MSEIEIITNYVEGLFEPKYNWPRYYFNQRSYSRWVGDEILRRIHEQESKPIISIVEEFINQMDEFSEKNNDVRFSCIFSIARDSAKDILFLLL